MHTKYTLTKVSVADSPQTTKEQRTTGDGGGSQEDLKKNKLIFTQNDAI